MSQVAELARNRWHSILPHFGVDRSYLKNRGGPCLKCGGKDRCRFDNKGGMGTFFCNQCGPYDGFKAIESLTGKPFREVAREVEKLVSVVPPEPPKPEITPRQYGEWMAQAWHAGQPIEWGDPVDQWLSNRLGCYALDDVGRSMLRYHPALPYRRDGKQVGVYPAMLARVFGPDGTNKQLHRTYLTKDGQQAQGEKSRMRMPGPGLAPLGSYVALCAHTDEVLGIAEGIETALAAAKLFNVPVHAALDAKNLEAWTPPATLQRAIVFGDNDESMTGQAAAFALARRLFQERGQGKLKCAVEVRIPPTAGWDWNNVLKPDL
jgi:putative DNA primase/helicase